LICFYICTGNRKRKKKKGFRKERRKKGRKIERNGSELERK
jgi:hypothetical protein